MTTMAAYRARGASARERILASAYELFSQHGIRAIGIDAIIKHSGVARMTLYRNFSSKNELVLEFLRERAERWTLDWLQREVNERGVDARERLLAIFDIFAEWFEHEQFEGCAFMNVMLETSDRSSPIRNESVERLAEIRGFLVELAVEARTPDPDDFARKWHILMKGAIVAACEGDRLAAHRAKGLGQLLLDAECR